METYMYITYKVTPKKYMKKCIRCRSYRGLYTKQVDPLSLKN